MVLKVVEKGEEMKLHGFRIMMFILMGMLLLSISSVCAEYNDLNRLKAGMPKEEVTKILGIKDSKIMEGGIRSTVSPTKKVQIILYATDKSEKENIEGAIGGDPNKTLVLCFENEKLVRWGYGRDEYIAVLKEYPSIGVLFLPGEEGR